MLHFPVDSCRDHSHVPIRASHKIYTDKGQLNYEIRLKKPNCIVTVMNDRKKMGVILRILNIYSSGCLSSILNCVTKFHVTLKKSLNL